MPEPSTTKATTLICMRHGGTHLFKPVLVGLTGRAVYSPKGRDALRCVPGPNLIVATRDPRNRLVSAFRYKTKWRIEARDADERLADLMRDRKRGMTPIEFMAAWARRWMGADGALMVRFEDLVALERGVDVADAMRAHIKAPYSAAPAYWGAIGKGNFTGRHSNWREWFGPASRREWKRQDGDAVVAAMGYA